MAKFMPMLLKIFTFVLALLSNFAFITSSRETLASTTIKDQIACTVCESCENPCQPLPSSPPPRPPPILPPPPLPPCPPPPSPPPLQECPPPPAPTDCPVCTPSPNIPQISPPKMPKPFPPPSGQFAPPDGTVPYFPNYYNPPPFPEYSNSRKLTLKSAHFSVLLYLALFCCF